MRKIAVLLFAALALCGCAQERSLVERQREVNDADYEWMDDCHVEDNGILGPRMECD